MVLVTEAQVHTGQPWLLGPVHAGLGGGMSAPILEWHNSSSFLVHGQSIISLSRVSTAVMTVDYIVRYRCPLWSSPLGPCQPTLWAHLRREVQGACGCFRAVEIFSGKGCWGPHQSRPLGNTVAPTGTGSPHPSLYRALRSCLSYADLPSNPSCTVVLPCPGCG